MSYTFFTGHDSGPSLNVANGNADVVFTMMGVDPYYCGTIKPEQLGAVLDSVQAQSPADYLKPTTERRGAAGCRVIDCGRTWEQVERYRSALLEIINYCQDHNLAMHWG